MRWLRQKFMEQAILFFNEESLRLMAFQSALGVEVHSLQIMKKQIKFQGLRAPSFKVELYGGSEGPLDLFSMRPRPYRFLFEKRPVINDFESYKYIKQKTLFSQEFRFKVLYKSICIVFSYA